ncbi:hypothetical protein AGMMS49965_16890 [Bacteroidia bacterium]|nr:hypothetical protein AGMMS49965_16890 [Bacteroidia bacterium]
MLKKILSVSGKPGLFRLISQGKNMFVVESLLDGKREPVYMRDKVISLHDIAMYTANEEMPLSQVLTKVREKEEGKPIVYKADITSDELKAYLATVLPDFDRDRVYPTDIHKMMKWYNVLTNAGFTDFADIEEEDADEADEATETADGTEKKPKPAKSAMQTPTKTATPKSAPKATTKSAARPAARGLKGASAKKG